MAEAVRPKQKHRKQKVKIKASHEEDRISPKISTEDTKADLLTKEHDQTITIAAEANECQQTDGAQCETGNVLDSVADVPSSQSNERADSTDEISTEKEDDTSLSRGEQQEESAVNDSKISTTQGNQDNEKQEVLVGENSRPDSMGSYTSILQGGPAVVEDPDTPMSRATSPAVSRTVSDESKSPPPSVPEPVVVEEKSPHLLAEEAFARMQVLAENLRVSAEEAKKKEEKDESTTKEEEKPISQDAIGSINLKSEQQVESVREIPEAPQTMVKSPTRLEVPKTKIRAMSLSELLELYHNPQLAYSQRFIEDFIQNEMKKEGHEFFEILSNYLRARLQLVSVEEEITLLQTSYNTLQEAVWVTSTKSIVVQGECGDKAKVTASHTYEQCQLDPEAVKQMESTLKKIREQITSDLSLFAYSSTISKLQVESYIHNLYTDSPLLRDIPKNSPVQAQSQYTLDQENMRQISKLKDCISILFIFHRKPVSDQEFVKNIRSWTTRLVSSLLRVATFRDHLFILNHLLRCPSGVGKWAADLVQFTKISPASISASGRFNSSFSNDVLDHVITALSTVLLPVKAREDFLSQMRVTLTQESIQEERTWILVDSDGEEDEEPSNAWLYLHENDVVAILNQFSLTDLFSHVLLSTVSESGQVDYDIRRCTEPIMMKLLSFATVLVQLFGSGLRTYNMVRYRQLNKRIGRLIRHTICFVSDHWLNFQTHYGPMTTTTSMQTLQMEFDQLFMRATYCILTAQNLVSDDFSWHEDGKEPKLGSWQFMADMPYTCVSEGAMWQLLWILHLGQGQVINLDFLPPAQECKAYLHDPDSWQQLADNLTHMPTSEAFFLMTTFANMACCRSYSEQDFVQTITYEVFEIAYISTHTRDFCSKMGRELLSSIILTHPNALSFLLARIKDVMSSLGKMALYLFSELPVGVWQPTDPDMLILRQWLLNFSLSFVENQLARIILSKINWDVFEQTGRPVVDIRLHRQTALLLVESYTRYISDKRAGFFITEGMKQMASYMTSTPSPEQVFNNWAWDLALKLKLHQQSVIWQASSQAVDPNFQAPSLSQEAWLLPVMKGSVNTPTSTSKIPIACFIALAMTDVGHDVTIIMRDGLDLLNHLTLSGQYTTSIHVLGCMVPLFVESPQYLLDNELFQQVLRALVIADESLLKSTKSAVMTVEFPGLIIRQLNEMIQAQITSHLMGPKADLLLAFWMKTIFKVSRCFVDRNCCYIANSLAQWCFVKKGITDLFMTIGKDYYAQLCAACKDSQNVMSTVMSWISSSLTVSPSFLDSPAILEFPWIAFLLMLVEGDKEGETGLWYSLQMNLQGNSRLSVDAALKSSVTSLRLQQAPPSNKLLIYRWARQALETPMDHPILPILWQRFFALYLGRQASQNNMSQRASVGERFFESMSHSGTLNRMRKRLRETSNYHLNFDPKKNDGRGNELSRSASSKSEDASAGGAVGGAFGGASTPSSPEDHGVMEYTSTKEFHLMLAKLYQTYLLWLEEPRLHDANLYLPALPPQYEASRLNLVFQGYMSPWMEFVDTEGVQYMLSCSAVDWRNRVTDARSPTQSLPDRHNLSEPENATKRIEQRLKRFDPPKDPPIICKIQTTVPFISPSIVVDKDAFLQLVSSDLDLLRQHTLIFSAKNANHSALDGVYIQLVPFLYSNVNKVISLRAECRSTLNPLHMCSHPAVIPVRINEKDRNEITFRRIQENRVEYKQLMIEMLVPTPLNICIAAVHTENAITCLIKQYQKSSNASQKQRLCDIGCTLFFQLTSLISEDTNFYPPAKHFFASCIEILGQEFVSEDNHQTETVLQLCLDKPLVSGLASPHFIPNSCPDRVVNMYGQLIHVLQEQNMDLVFMLLTKFDIDLWLEQHRPVESERKRLIEILGSSLTTCGQNPESSMVYGLYVTHLKSLLRSSFPSNVSCILNMILQGSATNSLNVQVWETFLAVCLSSDPPNSAPFDASSVEGCNEAMLSTAEVKEYLDWMGSYFMHARITVCQNNDAALGLYTVWANYAYYIGLFLGGLIRSYGAKILRVSDDISSPFEILNSLWNVYAPWIQPMVGDNDALNIPWTETDGPAANHIISSLSSSLNFLNQMITSLTPDRAPGLLSLVLMYYMSVLSTKTTPPHAMKAYLKAVERLPWDTLRPDLQLVEAMTKVREYASPCCFSLIGHVLPFVKWEAVNKYHTQHTPPEIASRMQTGIALLHIQSYVDPELLKRDGIYRLLLEAESFDWSAMGMEGITCVTNWFLQLGDPACVLAERSSRLAIGLRVLKQLCAFTSHGQWQEHMTAKRHMYVHVMTQQFCQLTYKKSTSRESVNTALVNLLSEIEAVESSVPSMECQLEESTNLLKCICGLLNNSNPEGEWLNAILATMTGWLQSSPQSNLLAPCMKAASTSLASLRHTVVVMEACIASYFSGLTSPSSSTALTGWDFILSIFHFPELNSAGFLQEALAENAFLVLYAYFRYKVPFCQTTDGQFALVNEILTSCQKAEPCTNDEMKVLLWWHLLLELLSKQFSQGHNPTSASQVITLINRFVPYLNAMGQDRNNRGLLGAIGFGQKSSLSKRMRLMSIVMSSYLQSQLINSNHLRVDASTPLPMSYVPKDLRNIRASKSYAGLSAQCDKAIVFMRDPTRSFLNSPEFVSVIGQQMFPDNAFLQHAFYQTNQ